MGRILSFNKFISMRTSRLCTATTHMFFNFATRKFTELLSGCSRAKDTFIGSKGLTH